MRCLAVFVPSCLEKEGLVDGSSSPVIAKTLDSGVADSKKTMSGSLSPVIVEALDSGAADSTKTMSVFSLIVTKLGGDSRQLDGVKPTSTILDLLALTELAFDTLSGPQRTSQLVIDDRVVPPAEQRKTLEQLGVGPDANISFIVLEKKSARSKKSAQNIRFPPRNLRGAD